MTSSEIPEPEYCLSSEFLKNLKTAGKAYPNKKQSEEFKTLIQSVITHVMTDPLAIEVSGGTGVLQSRGPEKPPGFLDVQAGSRFFKAYFKVPHKKGEASLGRVMYMVQEDTLIVDFLMYYTHAEFQGRPPDSYLKGVFRDAGVPRPKP